MAIDEALEVVARPPGQPLAQRILGAGNALAAAQGEMAAAEQRLGLEIEGAQELALPASPYPRPDRLDVGHRQQQQKLEALAALHQGGEVADGLRVVQITALGEEAH